MRQAADFLRSLLFHLQLATSSSQLLDQICHALDGALEAEGQVRAQPEPGQHPQGQDGGQQVAQLVDLVEHGHHTAK